jgi:hypothetical protein
LATAATRFTYSGVILVACSVLGDEQMVDRGMVGQQPTVLEFSERPAK